MNCTDDKITNGIGTLNERSLHSFLKEYYEPQAKNREVKIDRYVADIANESGITEIQTRGFGKMKPKLSCFLKDHAVTVVYPVAAVKRLIWVDPQTGETSKPRLSPRRGGPWDIFNELIYILDFLNEPNLRFKIVLLELEEYRLQNGWSRDGKKGSVRKDRIPTRIIEEIEIDSVGDYCRLLPQKLPPAFTAKDFAVCARVSPRLAQRAVKVLSDVGAVRHTGKRGRAFLYEKVTAEDSAAST